jgi:hypothetical protein
MYLINQPCTKHVKGLLAGSHHRYGSVRGDTPSAGAYSATLLFRRSRSAGAGSYLEGPYFTPQNKGAHPAEWFRELDLAELDEMIAISRDTLRVVALAPEKPEHFRRLTI